MTETRWPMVALGEVLRHRKEFIEIDDDTIYIRPRVQVAARGVTLRDRVPGSMIKTKSQQICNAGEFLVAEIDAKAGGFGLVPPFLDGSIVSSHYFLFQIDESSALPRFIEWYSRSPDFLGQVSAKGSTNYAAIRPSDVLAYRVPLPPLTEQALIVARLDGAAERLERRAAAAKAVEAELDATLRAAFRRLTAGAPEVRLGDVAPLVRRPVTVDPGAAYREIGARAFGRGLFHKPDLRADDLTWQQLYAIEEGDLVFSNIKAWEGAFAVATASHHGCVGSHRYLTCVTDPTRATAGFVWYYLQSPEGIAQVQAASPGSADRNRTLSTRGLANIAVPLPSLDAQHTFGRLQAKATAALDAQRAATEYLDKLLPAMLHEAFGETAVAEPLAAE